MHHRATLLLGLFFLVTVFHVDAKNKCYEAKTCIHDGKEKCGQNKSGKVRRFLDSCDIKEYNCLRQNSYQKVSSKLCEKLPSIGEQALNVSSEVDPKEETTEKENIKSEKTQPDSDFKVEDQKTIKPIQPGKAAVINEYWCWRAKYCHADGKLVCGRDRRLNKKRKFPSACDTYKHNCEYRNDFTVTNIKFCRRY